jgi:4-amino-4-deoxy-L-arabinose transferase-like glycosyltransferase
VRTNPEGAGDRAAGPERLSSAAWRIGFVGVLVLAGVLFFARLGERALWSEEVRWAEIARSMAASGDYLWPTINGHTYYDKPLGSYWLVLAGAWVRGGVDEAASRLPCAVSGLLAVAVLMLLARRLYGGRTSWIAGAVLATSFGFVVFARTASADVETVAGVLVALWLCVRNEGRGGGKWVIGLWGVMAITSLTKGLLGFALPLLVFGTYRLLVADTADAGRTAVSRFLDRQRWLLNGVTPFAVVVGLAVYAAPFLLSIHQTGSAEGLGMVWRENVRRFFDAHNHRGPVYLYAYVLFGLAAPWAVLLPAALVQAHVRRSRGDRFALAYFWAVFLFFTLSSSRRSYYLLPILPAVALLIGRLLATPLDGLTPWARRLTKVGFGVVATAVFLAVGVLVLPRSALPAPWDRLPPVPAPLAFGTLWVTATVGTVLVAVRFGTERLAVAFTLMAFGLMAYLFLFAQPDVERYRTDRPFLTGVRQRLGNEVTGLVLYRTRETVFYLAPPGPLSEAGTPNQLRALLENQSARWVLARVRDLPEVGFAGTVTDRQPVQPWEGPDVQKRKLVLLEVRR